MTPKPCSSRRRTRLEFAQIIDLTELLAHSLKMGAREGSREGCGCGKGRWENNPTRPGNRAAKGLAWNEPQGWLGGRSGKAVGASSPPTTSTILWRLPQFCAWLEVTKPEVIQRIAPLGCKGFAEGAGLLLPHPLNERR